MTGKFRNSGYFQIRRIIYIGDYQPIAEKHNLRTGISSGSAVIYPIFMRYDVAINFATFPAPRTTARTSELDSLRLFFKMLEDIRVLLEVAKVLSPVFGTNNNKGDQAEA
jgi:hypothetical protein